MKNSIVILIISIFVSNSYSQIDDILKKIPGVEDVFEKAVTTNIKDAYPNAYWLKNLDKKISLTSDTEFSSDLNPGYYRFKFNTFCLHAGTYEPTEGGAYLVAPLKGSKAVLIKNILTRYSDHPEIDQKDVQLLIWGIEVGQKFSQYKPDFQLRIQPLLTPDEIAMMEIDTKEIAFDLLPAEIKNVLNLYSSIRDKLSDASSTYEDIERLAVKTGIAPQGKGSIKIEDGTWSSVGDGVYMRCFPHGYQKSDVEIYIPTGVSISKDNSGKVISLDDGSCRIEFQYETGSSNFKSALIKDISSNTEINIENTSADNTSVKQQTDEFINLVKKSFGKKKSKKLSKEDIKTLSQLKMIELFLNASAEKNEITEKGNFVCINAVNSFISGLESGNKKGGAKSSITGLNNISGFVFVPGNTAAQRLGNGGPEGGKEKDKECKPEVILRGFSGDYLPKPGTSFIMTIEIRNLTEKCNVKKVKFTLESSKELGRCINDKESGWYDSRLDFFIDPSNGNWNVAPDSLSAEANGLVSSIIIGCSDYGAFGNLSAEVEINGVLYVAKEENSNNYFVKLPRDKNNNNIADSWENFNNVSGLPATWDEDPEPLGQASNGDGLTNYEEYRGVFVDDGSGATEHMRTNPKLKEIFVIDEKQKFDISSWKSASGIQAYWLRLDLVNGSLGGSEKDLQYRRVNFCGEYAKGEKYAINLVMRDGLNPGPECGNSRAFGCSWGPPKFADITLIFPDMIKKWLKDAADGAESELKKSPSGLYYNGKFLTASIINKFIDAVRNTAKFDELVNFILNTTIIHEVGHACGMPHHCTQKTNEGKCLQYEGVKNCPMRYSVYSEMIASAAGLSEIMEMIDKGENLIVSYTSMKFCKTIDKCWKQLQVNDRLNYPIIPPN